MVVQLQKSLFRKNYQAYSILVFVLCYFTIVKTVLGQDMDENSIIDKAVMSFRIGISQSLPANRWEDNLDLFNKYEGVTDEITFFTSETHPAIPLDLMKERMDIFAERMQRSRAKGFKVGINVQGTMGHHSENLDNSLKGDYTLATDIDGNICKGSFCANDDNLREYIRKMYQIVTMAEPDYIWIDDDIRLAHHKPLYLTCFCDNCLSIFEKETGEKYTRKEFKAAVNEGTIAKKFAFRKLCLQHNRNTIERLLKFIEETVHDINPQMPLGFMTGNRFFEGYDIDNWANILAGPNKTPVMWRPGGGFYQDVNMAELIRKIHDIGRQVSLLPPEVISIQAEIENFTNQRLKKAANMVVLEASSYIAAGCTGATFNVMSPYDEPQDEYEPLVDRIQKARPFLDLLAKSFERSEIVGINTLWSKNSFATSNLSSGTWFRPGNYITRHEIDDIGLPTCYSEDQASVTILGSDDVYSLNKKEIADLLSHGVFMDAETLQHLNDMGYGDLTGFKVVSSHDVDRIEKFTNHPLNGDYNGRERDNRQSYWGAPVYALEKTNEQAQALTSLIDYVDNDIAPCTMGIFENRLGGRICVAGYYPWTFIQTLSKSSQMKSVFRWLSSDTLPGYIDSYHKINLWIREPQNGTTALAFTNASFDPAEGVVLKLRTTSKAINVYDMQCNQTIIQSIGTDGVYQDFVIPYVDPWQMRLIVTEL
jgi:hypothetical protein